MESKMLYTIPEVAEIIGSNEQYVHRLRRNGLLKCIKLGRYKVRHETLNKFLEDFDGKDVEDTLRELEEKE